MAANKKTKKMLNTSRGMKVISILVASCMLFALTGCGAIDDSAATEPTTQVAEVKTTEATTTEATTTETTTETTTAAPTTTTAPTTEATTEATTTVTTAVTTETPTEAPSLTVPDVPDNAEVQVEEHTTVAPVEDVPEDPPEVPDDGYWHEDSSAAQANAEQALALVQQTASSYGWTMTSYPLGYGNGIYSEFYYIYVRLEIPAGSDGAPHSYDGAVSGSPGTSIYWNERGTWADPSAISVDVFDLNWTLDTILDELTTYGV